MTVLSDGLKDSPFREAGEPTPRLSRPSAIDLVIGIDYGTRFTKIAVGTIHRRQVWQDAAGKRLFPSIVHVAPDGTVTSYPERPPTGAERIEYLKMLLADPNLDVFRSVRSHVNGKPIRDVVRPLAAMFLSGLVMSVRTSMIRSLPVLSQRPVNWFLNLGVPVAHCDANFDVFKEVAAVAFYWAQHSPGKMKIDDLCAAYAHTVQAIDMVNSPASVVPELTAALHEFVRDPNRPDSLYGFFDIGGGTVDGAIFRINRTGEGFPLNIHAARVDCTGTMAVSRMMLAELYSKLPHYIEGPLLGFDERPNISIPLSEPLAFRDDQSARDHIQTLVATVIGKTRRQLYGQMFSARVDASARDTPALRVFLAGGGANSAWYKTAIERTFAERNLSQWGLIGIRSDIVARPADYQQNDYPRFVIALGLADLSAALVDARLPSQIQDAEPLPVRRSPTSITKDDV
jgi:hypothetical protein